MCTTLFLFATLRPSWCAIFCASVNFIDLWEELIIHENDPPKSFYFSGFLSKYMSVAHLCAVSGYKYI